MEHLTDEELGAYMDGVLKGRDAEAAGRHIADCQPCREALAEMAAQDASLRPALTHDPGEAYFERFAGRVDQRIAAASRARPRGALDLGRFFRSPRALAWAGGLAVLVVGGGLALMTGRDSVLPGLHDRDLAGRLERPAPREAKQGPAGETRPAPPPAPPPSAPEGAAAPSTGGEAEEITGGEVTAEREPGDAKARADEIAAVPSPTPPASPAPAGARAASPSRMVEVRRNEAGEEVPVRPPTMSRFAPPPSPATGSDADRLVRKKRFAEPLGAAKAAPKETLGATESRDQAREYSFAQPPKGTAAPGAVRQAAPARIEGETRMCGEVRDAAERPIVGAQVVLTDLGRATTTDATGRFCIDAPRGEHPISVMAVGYVESRQRIRTDEAAAGVHVTLAAVSVLEERGLVRGGRAAPTRSPVATRSEPQSPPTVEPRDSYSGLSDTVRRVVREAQRIEADAATRRSAATYDLAAKAWERALRHLAEGPLEIETRRHLAEARYRAWELGPSSRRALAAVEALTAYAGRAPAGPERDEAARRLQRVRP